VPTHSLKIVILFWEGHRFGLERWLVRAKFSKQEQLTWANSRLYCSIKMGSISTSAGRRAGAATKSSALFLKNTDCERMTKAACMRFHVPNEFPRQPEEGLLEVVVRLGGDLEILDRLLPVEGDSPGLYFSLLR
jgi:hypothetical protein